MTAKLVSVENFAIRAGLGDVDNLADEVQTKVQYALEAATIHLEAYLRTEFAAVTGQVDYYYVDYNERPFIGEFPRFYLSRGFVTTAVGSLVMKVSWRLDDLTAETPVSNEYSVLDQTKGTLLITGTNRLEIGYLNPVSGNKWFASIQYDAGFNEVADAFGSIYEGTPSWLQEAAMMLGKKIFDDGMPCDESDKSDSCQSMRRFITSHIRYLPSALKPMS